MNAWDLDEFKKTFDIQIHNLGDEVGNFDLIGVDSSIANAFRRIMMAEVPNVAVEDVVISNNTSVIHDEVLAHRIGLVPLRVDPDKLEWYPSFSEPVIVNGVVESPSTDSNTVQFSLKVACTKKNRDRNAPESTNPDDLYENHTVYSGDLKYCGSKEQLQNVFGGEKPTVVNPNIVLAKLRPGQEIDLVAYAIIGVGCDHAKFSPVATASYRLMPLITLKEPITGKDAEKLQKMFSPGVIGLKKKNGEKVAYVQDSRRDTVSREVLRHEEFKDKVELGRKRDHFIFNVESTGSMQPDEIFVKSIDILRTKCQELLKYDVVNQ